MTKELEILFQDDDIVVVNKPVGVLVHQAESFSGDDVYHLLVDQGVEIHTSGDDFRQGIVSRLDVGTSGVLVVAKNEKAYISLKQQFQEHSVIKLYTALAQGHFNVKKGEIDAPIGRHPTKRALFAIVEDGKPSKTDFDVIQEFEFDGVRKTGGDGIVKHETFSLLQIQLLTGRTHQIRVHLSAYGHPLVGDPLYNPHNKALLEKTSAKLTRPFLHSSSLTIQHPSSGDKVTFEAPLPSDLQDFLTTLQPSS
jgi:23S rRNA pseudouridine1911/1915/1917 synthase